MTLEQLIEKCGDEFRWLKKKGHGKGTVWIAQQRQHPVEKGDVRAQGKTAREAMENLVKTLGI